MNFVSFRSIKEECLDFCRYVVSLESVERDPARVALDLAAEEAMDKLVDFCGSIGHPELADVDVEVTSSEVDDEQLKQLNGLRAKVVASRKGQTDAFDAIALSGEWTKWISMLESDGGEETDTLLVSLLKSVSKSFGSLFVTVDPQVRQERESDVLTALQVLFMVMKHIKSESALGEVVKSLLTHFCAADDDKSEIEFRLRAINGLYNFLAPSSPLCCDVLVALIRFCREADQLDAILDPVLMLKRSKILDMLSACGASDNQKRALFLELASAFLQLSTSAAIGCFGKACDADCVAADLLSLEIEDEAPQKLEKRIPHVDRIFSMATNSESAERAMDYFCLHLATFEETNGQGEGSHQVAKDLATLSCMLPYTLSASRVAKLAAFQHFVAHGGETGEKMGKLVGFCCNGTLADYWTWLGAKGSDTRKENVAWMHERGLCASRFASKMRILSLIDIAHKAVVKSLDTETVTSRVLSLESLAQSLGVGTRAVQKWIVWTAGHGLLDAKVNQSDGSVYVVHAAERVFGNAEWKILEKLTSVVKTRSAGLFRDMDKLVQAQM